MRSKKTWILFIPIFLFATIGEGAGIEKERFKNAINYLSALVAHKYQLSTTGYQSAMIKDSTKLTPQRAKEYTAKAKEVYPTETLKNLGILQSTYINKIPETGELSDPHHMNEKQLTACLGRCREKSFANCEIQSLEIAIHLYTLGFKKFKIWSNKAISHNYVVIEPTTLFPKGAIIDSYFGWGITEVNFKTINKYKHYSQNIQVVQNMLDWVDKNATAQANKYWIAVIRTKFFPEGSSTPLDSVE
jgi:hypothetical protein